MWSPGEGARRQRPRRPHAIRALRSRRPAPRRGLGDVDHGHALLVVIPAVEALDARYFDIVEAEEARDVDGGGLLRLADLRRSLFLLIERLDADHFAFLVVVEIRAGLAAQAEHVGH